MTDETLDPRFERDLRSVLDASEPADAPASLYASVAAIPLGAQSRYRRGWASGRMAFAGLAMAAVVVIAVGVLALLRPWGGLPPVGGPTAAPPTVVPVPGLVLTYQVEPVNGVQPGPQDLEAVVAVLQARIAASLGTASSISTGGDGEITVRVAIDATDEAAVSALSQLLGTTGKLDFVPLGDTPASTGQELDLAANPPLFSGDQVASAKIGSDQTGARTVDFTLRPEGARLFADFTAANIGTYFAIVLDGEVISAPVINSSIPNGEMQITQGGVGGYPLADAQRLVAIVQSGALPFPIEEVSFVVAPAVPGGPARVTPVPSDLVLRTASPSPTSEPSPSAGAADPLIAAALAYASAAGIELEADGAPVVTEASPDFENVVMRQVTLRLAATHAAELRIWFDDTGRIAVVSDGGAVASLEGPDIDAPRAIATAGEQLRLAGIEPATGTLTVAGGGTGGDWYLTLDRTIGGQPVANTVMAWRISGDRAYVALRRDGALRDLYAIRPSAAPAPQVLPTDTLDAGLATVSGLSAKDLAALHPALAWVRATDASSGIPAPALTLGYCATQVRDNGWNGWCVDAGTGQRSVIGGGVD